MRRVHAREGDGGPNAPLICLVAAPEEPLDALPQLASSLLVVQVDDWGRDLTPWPAPSPYGKGETYGGCAAQTLEALLEEEIPQVERDLGISPASRAIAGYSLAGLFALWALAGSGAFDAAGSGSGSLWYPGWTDWLASQPFDGAGRRAYLSLGSKERRVKNAQVAGVADATDQTIALLRSRGVTCAFEPNPGGHFTDISGRIARMLTWLDGGAR